MYKISAGVVRNHKRWLKLKRAHIKIV